MKIRCGGLFFRCGVVVLGMWLLALSALAQDLVTQQGAKPDETIPSKTEGNFYSLSGTVLNSVTGLPIRRAAVQVSGQNGSVTLTDAGGNFSLDGLAEGDVFLSVMKPGFYDSQVSRRAAARVGKDAPAVVLKLTPWGVISGRVTTRDEQPLEGFQIRIHAQQNVAGRLVWVEQANVAQTNEDGEFRLAGLQAGNYYVAVGQSAGMTLSQKGVPNAREETFAKTFYPGVSDLSSATPIEIGPGTEAEVNFALSGELVYQIAGSLTGKLSTISGLVFARKAGDEADFSQTVEVQNGKFQVKLPAGAYSVGGATPEGVEFVTPGAAVLIRADDAALHVPLSPAATVPVEIQKEQGAGGAARKVPVQGGVPGMFLQLVPVGQSSRGTNSWRGQAGGIPNVVPGTYRLQITSTGDWWVKSAQSGSVDLLSDDLVVVEGEQPEPIEVTLRDGAGSVNGTVTPAGEPGRVLVLLVQRRGATNFIQAARVMEGNFVIPGVAPGDYAVLALDDGDRLEYANPEVLNPYLSDAEQASVQAHGTATVNLGLTSVKR